MQCYGVTFDLAVVTLTIKICFCFFNDKDIWIAATDYYMYFDIIVVFPLTAILQLITFTAS